MNAETTKRNRVRLGARGFSLLELVIVMAITFVVAAMATPSIVNGLASYKLKSGASQYATLLQRARSEAVRQNATVRVNVAMQDGLQMAWIDADSNGVRNNGEPMLLLPERVTVQMAGYPGDATSGLNQAGVNYPVMPVDGAIAARFNSRGLPCTEVGTQCRNITLPPTNQAQGFVTYFRIDRPMGDPGWGAVVVTPAGRIRSMTYSSNKYQ